MLSFQSVLLACFDQLVNQHDAEVIANGWTHIEPRQQPKLRGIHVLNKVC